MMIELLHKKLIVIAVLWLLIAVPNLSAQLNIDNHLLFGKNHFALNLSFVRTNVYKLPTVEGIGTFDTKSGHGIGMGLHYIMNPYPFLGIETGLGVGVQNFNYTLSANKEDFGITESIMQRTNYPEPYLEFPLLLVPRVGLNDKNWLYAKGGIVLNFYMRSYYSVEINDPSDPVFGENISGINLFFEADNPYAKASIGIGWLHRTKQHDLLNLSVMSNIGFTPIMQGEYRFRHPTKVASRGFFGSNGSYVTVQVGYVFTGAKKALEVMDNLQIDWHY